MGTVKTQLAISGRQAKLLVMGQHCIQLSSWLKDPMEILK